MTTGAMRSKRVKERGETPATVSTQKSKKTPGAGVGAKNLGIGPSEGKFKKGFNSTTKLTSLHDI